ncbi:hypothetical protein BBAD15_g11226 [Beauveria bassiana D1-5]|uniref:Uncharacterized protein n=1 Tax=Beauveria bassiana D1-5 TaxID=1245745 RepID=A0A0A2VB06_BEABA|nr:hypothetical protein BBAD15_g11226 [Beauveria bassiana D1-5]
MAEDYPVHRRSIFENVQAFIYDINHNQAEVAACVAAYPDSAPLIYSVLPTAEPGSLPAPPAQTSGLDTVDATDSSSCIDEQSCSGNRPAKRKRRNSPDNAYKRAVAIANRLPQELGSAHVLSELQRDLQCERIRNDHNAQRRQRANPERRSHSEEKAANHSEDLEDDCHNLQPSPRFDTAVERVQDLNGWGVEDAAERRGRSRWPPAVQRLAAKYMRNWMGISGSMKQMGTRTIYPIPEWEVMKEGEAPLRPRKRNGTRVKARVNDIHWVLACRDESGHDAEETQLPPGFIQKAFKGRFVARLAAQEEYDLQTGTFVAAKARITKTLSRLQKWKNFYGEELTTGATIQTGICCRSWYFDVGNLFQRTREYVQ